MANSRSNVNAVFRSFAGISTSLDADSWLKTSPITTDLRNFEVRSTTSSQTKKKDFIFYFFWNFLKILQKFLPDETEDSSNNEGGGNIIKASNVSCKRSVHRSESSPLRQALLKKANAKLRAALDPKRAKPEGPPSLLALSLDFLL